MYAARAAGLVTLLLLTASVLLGVITAGRFSSDRWPRFLTAGLHRNISLLVLVFLALHVSTTVFDTFVSIPVAAAFVPFVSSYKTFWLGLGAIALDLLLALSITSLLRNRLGHRSWRRVHWLAYACWPIGLAHGLGAGTDRATTWVFALTARFGDRWFRGIGRPSAPGSALVTVSGAVARPGVHEIEMGTPAGQVVMLAGGPAERPAALLVGGYFGAWLPAETAWPVPMCHAALRAVGGAMGAGMVIVLPVSSCGLAETARVVRYLAGENAGQCGPCMFGLPALADAMTDLAYHGGRGGALERVASLAALVAGRGACRHPDGAVQLVRSTLRAFEADALRHDHRGPCPGVARAPLLPVPGDADWDWA